MSLVKYCYNLILMFTFQANVSRYEWTIILELLFFFV